MQLLTDNLTGEQFIFVKGISQGVNFDTDGKEYFFSFGDYLTFDAISERVFDFDISFTIEVKTDNAGSANNKFILPLKSGETYDFAYTTSDGTSGTHNTDSDLTLTFPSGAGTYTIKINGTLPAIYFSGGGDKEKLVKTLQLGIVGWTTMELAFRGCKNNDMSFCTTVADTGNVVKWTAAWRNGIKAGFPLIDTSSGEDFKSTFRNNPSLNGYDFPLINMHRMTDGDECFSSATLSTLSWSNLLVDNNANNDDPDCLFGGGGSKRNAAGTVAHGELVGRDPGWTIEDGGEE